MENIKFRVWDNVDYMSKPFTLLDVQRRLTQFAHDCTVMRFTGLTDKNGVEIYEGDIVKWQAGLVSGNNAIVYNDGSFCIDSAFQDDMSIYQSYASQGLEVIGNVHQNPELLEQNDE